MQNSSNLDLLRSVAVILVFAEHVLAPFGLPSVLGIVSTDIGKAGVMIFFVHTSLVLMYSLERLRSGGAFWKQFYVRRAFRIYPLSILCVLTVTSLRIPDMVSNAFHAPNAFDLAANLALVQNLTLSRVASGPLWSLPIEVQMYLLLPPLYLLVRRERRWKPFLGLYAIVVLLGVAQPLVSARLNVIEFAPCFFGGLLAFGLCLAPHRQFGGKFWPPAIFAAGAAFFLLRATGLSMIHRGWVMCLLLGIAIPRFGEIRSRWLAAPAAKIAQYSYGIYLCHVPVLWFSFTALAHLDLALRWAICAGLMCTLPVVLYHCIEHPMIRLGGRVAAGVGSPVRTAPASPRLPRAVFPEPESAGND